MDMHIKLPSEHAAFIKHVAEVHNVTPVAIAAHVLHEAIYITACPTTPRTWTSTKWEPEFHASARQVVALGPSDLKGYHNES